MKWINVKDQLPKNDKNVFYTNRLSGALGVAFYINGNWYNSYSGELIIGITHWINIPSFDEILEENKDVLIRMKNM